MPGGEKVVLVEAVASVAACAEGRLHELLLRFDVGCIEGIGTDVGGRLLGLQRRARNGRQAGRGSIFSDWCAESLRSCFVVVALSFALIEEDIIPRPNVLVLVGEASGRQQEFDVATEAHRELLKDCLGQNCPTSTRPSQVKPDSQFGAIQACFVYPF
jgi:hypothetical protein